MSSIKQEFIRLLLITLVVILFAATTGQLLAPFIIALILYLAWTIYKLHQFETWALDEFDAETSPPGDGIWANITDKVFNLKQLAEKNKNRQAKLIKQFSKIITAMPNAIIVLDARNEIQWLNRDAARLLKLNRKQDVGNNILNLIRIPKLNQALLKKSARNFSVNSPHRENVILSLHISKLRQNIRIIVIRDISLREQLAESRRIFVANASHELKTPLTVISGYLEMLQHKTSDPESLKMLDNSKLQAQRMDKLISDLLTLSKLEHRELSARKTSLVNFSTIIRETTKALNDTTGSAHTFILNLDENLKINGSEKELRSLVNNLLSNAINHTPAATEVKIVWQKYLDVGLLKVIDNGPGIQPEDLPHLSERFYQVNKSIDKGTGLGLSLVKHIVQRHGAKLQIQSEPDEYTSFSVEFPAYRLYNKS